jgi:cytochrome c oxidase subunit 2
MASIESPVAAPAPGWARKLPKDERLFLWIVAASVTVMSAFVIGWLVLSDHNVPTDFKRTTPAAFSQQVSDFMAKYGQADGTTAKVPPGKDAYILAYRFSFLPQRLVLKAGHEYRIWLSAADTLHGFSIVGGGQNINLELAPNHAYGATFKPAKPGTYLVVCNEYCGLGHHGMYGRIIVER